MHHGGFSAPAQDRVLRDLPAYQRQQLGIGLALERPTGPSEGALRLVHVARQACQRPYRVPPHRGGERAVQRAAHGVHVPGQDEDDY